MAADMLTVIFMRLAAFFAVPGWRCLATVDALKERVDLEADRMTVSREKHEAIHRPSDPVPGIDIDGVRGLAIVGIRVKIEVLESMRDPVPSWLRHGSAVAI